MNNSQFLQILKQAFLVYLDTGARSNKKLEILHGAIASDLNEKSSENTYKVHSLGFGEGKERKVAGRYIKNKAVDIVISENNHTLAGIAVKYVMSNYTQNSNNYFENMLGETANMRSAGIPYFQILVMPDILPYFKKDGNISKWETLKTHHIEKYLTLSNDNINDFLHTPNKKLIYLVHIENHNTINNKVDYCNYYRSNAFEVIPSIKEFNFGNAIIYNDYEKFISKVAFNIKSL